MKRSLLEFGGRHSAAVSGGVASTLMTERKMRSAVSCVKLCDERQLTDRLSRRTADTFQMVGKGRSKAICEL